MISKYRVGLNIGHLQNRWVGIHLVTQQHPQVVAVNHRKRLLFNVNYDTNKNGKSLVRWFSACNERNRGKKKPNTLIWIIRKHLGKFNYDKVRLSLESETAGHDVGCMTITVSKEITPSSVQSSCWHVVVYQAGSYAWTHTLKTTS